MKCDIVSYNIAVSDNFNSATSASRGCIKCNTHNMVDFAPYGYENMLCPIGQIEAAVELGLAKIASAIKQAPNQILRQAIHSDQKKPPYPGVFPVTNNKA